MVSQPAAVCLAMLAVFGPQAAEVLDYRNKPGVVVVVTDGEETCGRSPCELGEQLHAAALQLAVHVIGYRLENYFWTGEQSVVEAKCLAERNNGLLYHRGERGGSSRRVREDS